MEQREQKTNEDLIVVWGDLLLVLDLRRSEKMQELVIAPEGLTVVSAENTLEVYLITSKDQETKKWTCKVKIRRK